MPNYMSYLIAQRLDIAADGLSSSIDIMFDSNASVNFKMIANLLNVTCWQLCETPLTFNTSNTLVRVTDVEYKYRKYCEV